jgi:SagB-type dehydrogenase family enzyme
MKYSIMTVTWREYHEATKHSPESLRRSRYTLDWANMPNPFRNYEGVPLFDLPADPPDPSSPGIHEVSGAMWLSSLLYHAAAISASKVVPSTGERYALRVNPSSGNLHPTEFHFVTKGLRDWPDGLYHYRVASHMAEQRGVGLFTETAAPVTFLLTTIAWREAWKYRDRAYRYCLHDVGHAWQALALSAQAMDCEVIARGGFDDDEIAKAYELAPDEWPMLLIELQGPSLPAGPSQLQSATRRGGIPNVLSADKVEYPLIDDFHRATKVRAGTPELAKVEMPCPIRFEGSFAGVVRKRRSALDFTGGSMSLPDLLHILQMATKPLAADFASERFIRLYLYVHGVRDLERGVYRHDSETNTILLIKPGDQRVAAAGLSLGQALAGNACVAFSMVADLQRVTELYGNRGYRYAYFEAGAIGQRMYIGAEAAGLQATGIGAFYDDKVHEYLELQPQEGQVIYHFAMGHAIPDLRVQA